MKKMKKTGALYCFMLFIAVWNPYVSVAGTEETSVFRVSPKAKNIIVTAPENKKSTASFNRMFAAKDLAAYLKKILNVDIPIVTEVTKEQIKSGGLIFVGPSKYMQELKINTEWYDLGRGGFLVETIGGNLVLLGDDTEYGEKIGGREWGETGTYYAVATFLEKFCGVRWLWPGESGTVVHPKKEILVPHTGYRSAPAYFCRFNHPPLETGTVKPDGSWILFKGERFQEWSIFQRRHRMGSSMSLAGGHYGEAYLKSADFEKHPEYFSMIQGKRKPWTHKGGFGIIGQVCCSNPEVVELFARKTLENVAKGEWKRSSAIPSSPFTPNDGGLFCMCPECKKMDGNISPWSKDTTVSGQIPGEKYNEKIGWASNLSNRIWKFNNQVGKRVAGENPSVLLACSAYGMYVNPPDEVKKIEDNIIVSICDYYLANGGPEEYQKGVERYLKWSEKARNLGIRGYYYSLGCRPHRIAEMFRILYNIGCRYHKAEASQTYGANWIEYIINKKAQWDPFLDVDAVIDDYFNAAYGPGASAMKKYLELQEKISMQYNVMYPFRYPDVENANWTKAVREKLRACLNEAIAATKGTEYEARVRFSEPAWEMIDSYCELVSSLKKLKAMGVSIPEAIKTTESVEASPEKISSEISVAAKEWKRFKNVMLDSEKEKSWSTHWFSILKTKMIFFGAAGSLLAIGSTVENLENASSQNAIILPAFWKFSIDPEAKGIKEGWFNSDFNDGTWGKIRVDTSWENQGYGKEKFPENGSDGYDGKGWYRLNVDIPQERKDDRVFLELGAVDESGIAWVNGQKVWSFSFEAQNDASAWSKAKRFEITDAVKFGQKNTIAVQVEDKAGAGGIWKPCFILFEKKK